MGPVQNGRDLPCRQLANNQALWNTNCSSYPKQSQLIQHANNSWSHCWLLRGLPIVKTAFFFGLFSINPIYWYRFEDNKWSTVQNTSYWLRSVLSFIEGDWIKVANYIAHFSFNFYHFFRRQFWIWIFNWEKKDIPVYSGISRSALSSLGYRYNLNLHQLCWCVLVPIAVSCTDNLCARMWSQC